MTRTGGIVVSIFLALSMTWLIFYVYLLLARWLQRRARRGSDDKP
jgi:hypothetical protein